MAGLMDPERRRLRWQLYNATLESVRSAHEALAVFRVRPDTAVFPVEAGQYTLLGLGSWEPRVDDVERRDRGRAQRPTLIRRVYSITSPLLADDGSLARVGEQSWLEFFIALVAQPRADRPTLTPRLFALQPGDRLFLGPRARGRYTLAALAPHDDVIFCSTGTGEAPHNAMIAELLARGHQGRIVSAVTTRHQRDLAYLEQHREVERRWDNYRYVPLTTREKENTDPASAGYVGKRYLQDVFGDDDLCRDLVGFVPRFDRAHFFLCGNPSMIGLPMRTDEGPAFPESPGMAQLLTERGFVLDEGRTPGNVHFEKYW